jgi:hypothetical protein
MRPTEIVRHSEGANTFQRSSGSARWGAVSLPIEDIVPVGATMGGFDLTPPRDTQSVTPLPAAMARLQRLHAAAAHLAEESPEIIANPDAAWGMEQTLIGAMVSCLSTGETREDSVAQRQHELIMRRFHRVLEGEAGSIALRYGNLQADRGLRAYFASTADVGRSW